LWHRNGATVLKYAIPPLIALLVWACKQLVNLRSERSTPEQLADAQQALASRGLEWWRGVPEPAWPGHLLRAGLRPLDVTWAKPLSGGGSAGDGPVHGSTGNITGLVARFKTWAKPLSGGEPAGDGPVHGSTGNITGLVASFKATRPCRLVIRGSAGSGKSVLARMMMAELLKDSQPGDPVPVFLPLWSWDPHDEGLHDWMKRQIGQAYPELREEAAYGPTAVPNLVDQGRVLPILDGLDALPERCREAVLADGELMSQDRLILTCRGNDLDNASGFVVIAAREVDDSEARRFLSEVTRRPAISFAHLKDHLSDPRIVYLACIVCDNNNLACIVCDNNKTDAGPLEKQLLAQVIPALMPANGDWAKPFPWYANNAKYWLSNLARLDLRDPDNRDSQRKLDDPGDSRIAWWNLYRGLPWLRAHQALSRAMVTGLLAFGLITLIFRTDRDWRYSLMTAGAYGFVILVAGAFLGRETVSKSKAASLRQTSRPTLSWWLSNAWKRWWRVYIAAILSFFCFGALIGYRTALSTGPHVGLRVGLWDGIMTGGLTVVLTFFIAGVPTPPRTVRSVDQGNVARHNSQTLAATLILGILFGVLWGITAVIKHQHPQVPELSQAILTGLITGVDFVLGAWIFGWAQGWLKSRRARNPRSAARLDIVGAVICPLILGATFAFAFGVSAPFNFTGVDVAAWFVVGVALGSLGSEWPLYIAAITWYAVRKKLPLRLMRFLECCRSRGVVRVVGQEYQFHDNDLLGY